MNNKENDLGAGLIGQPIPDVVETEPRPNEEQARQRVMRAAFDGLAGKADVSAALDAYAQAVRGNVDRAHLAEVLCWVSQIFNGWRGWEEWSTWDEEVAQAVVAIQRALEVKA